ncbi:hypothetical protein ACFQ6U_32380 [Streptomyces sp. NPDC056465]|uniref:hypothetical protein n=1 Tax=Streptomyces sp. NPDC056465 TaxID=3345829 RepID=UPI0036AE5304
MPVSIAPTSGHSAEITWSVEDDPYGRLARATEGPQLACALGAIGGAYAEVDPARALQAAAHITSLARLLERHAAVQVVHLRDTHHLSWRQIAAGLHGDPDRQSTVRRQYDSGRRHIGLHTPTRENSSPASPMRRLPPS